VEPNDASSERLAARSGHPLANNGATGDPHARRHGLNVARREPAGPIRAGLNAPHDSKRVRLVRLSGAN
tara:strand:- start:500 stop:706 length:207 start_codon:yes stop_codon:yes gene_type:complete